MGIFDTYIIPCPYCNSLVEEQRKPGYMDTYVFGQDPKQDVDFEGRYTCYNCNNSFSVAMESLPKMIVIKDED